MARGDGTDKDRRTETTIVARDRTPPSRFINLQGGRFRKGSDDGLLSADGEGPARIVNVSPFFVDPYAVTNEWFAEFVRATGYVTDAERFGWSFVFHLFAAKGQPAPGTPWWLKVDGAYWARPEGLSSGIDERGRHPVVHVSWNDAAAFAAWAGGRLLTEAEWEFAASGGQPGSRFPWGNREPNDTDFFPCNIWQGSFPELDLRLDGFSGTAPVDSYQPNGFGLYNFVGNSWEWCSDDFRVRSMRKEARTSNAIWARDKSKVMKGGSYLCHNSYCYRYRIAARTKNTPDTSTGHLGFRIAFDA